jgi:hypothetical protein
MFRYWQTQSHCLAKLGLRQRDNCVANADREIRRITSDWHCRVFADDGERIGLRYWWDATECVRNNHVPIEARKPGPRSWRLRACRESSHPASGEERSGKRCSNRKFQAHSTSVRRCKPRKSKLASPPWQCRRAGDVHGLRVANPALAIATLSRRLSTLVSWSCGM